MSSTPRYRIAIVGFGSAGASAGIMLAARGHEVHLFERAPQNEPVGAGFLLQPSGMKVLRDMGILDELLPETARVEKLFCRNTRDQVMLDLHYNDLAQSLFGAGTHRGTFLTLLEKHAITSGVHLHWGHPIASFTQSTQKVALTEENGTTHKDFDLLLIGDGARSELRKQTSIPTKCKQYPWGALWFIGQRTEGFATDTLWQAVESTNLLNGFLPTGTRDDLLSLFWSIRMDRVDKWFSSDLNQWKEQVCYMAPQAEDYLKQIHDHRDLKVASYYDVVMPYWHDGRTVILGDAAHALSPQLGQGVNLALLDAATLVESIERFPLNEALSAYSRTRKAHLAFYQRATRWTTPFFQSDMKALGLIRDLAFPLANSIPYVRNQMVATMAGLKSGIFSMMATESPSLPARKNQYLLDDSASAS
ncbi:2-polyprenyl-6-methoxyphenol hydroxylase [Rubritalea squalenifaciens DSM 18772]|uniref:2-polyprenyl-6-methoxyphenol hydroxylase n=1 Tax=Rubritalea squalenifaciens DSM 18772 TaxID=1123071 RepID=A0A1M6HUR4_9BACT|nr:NAD(P)/FAD-dependent oxidoreductase [Rubritalea squalenifaciens]SHJ25864.1 2-polyprenyl-6-methoxyphenol hydroxylase [Rubritalea squalenifaciens DSM 18772]